MRGRSQRLTPVQIFSRHLMTLIQETPLTMTTYAAEVRTHHEAAYPEHARTVEWSQVVDPVTRMLRDQEKISRWFDHTVSARLPVEVYDSLIAPFPADRRFDLEQELAAQRGNLVFPIPNATGAEDAANLGAIAKETGEAITAIGALFDDGVIDRNDGRDGKAQQAIKEIEEAIGRLAQMRERIESAALKNKPTTAPIALLRRVE